MTISKCKTVVNREDGPAVERANGDKFWYLNDILHREDGPAIEFTDGTEEWYLNGKNYRFVSWIKKIKKSPKHITMLCIKYSKGNKSE